MEGFTQAITLLNQGRVDAIVNDSIAVYAYQAETNDQSVKIAATIDEKSEQAFAARKNSGLLPELNKALDELKADGTLAKISREVPQGQRHRRCPQATLDVEADRTTTCGRWPRRRSPSPSR